MTTTDPTTLALTGQLPFILILGALLAFPISLLLLRFYRQAVLKGMNRPSNSPPKEGKLAADSHSELSEPATTSPLGSIRITNIGDAELNQGALYQRANTSTRQAILVYSAGGLAFSAVMAFAFLKSSNTEILPMRFLILLCAYAWPLVLTLSLVTTAHWRTKFLLITIYGCSYTVLATTGLLRSPDSSIGQIVTLWLTTNLPPTLVVLLLIIRRVRAIAPLVEAFMLLAISGSIILLSMLQQDQAILLSVANIGFSLGLGANGLFWTLNLIGFIVFAVPGWYLLNWIRRQYRNKRANDRSLLLDSLWFLFGLSYAISLVFEGEIWIFSGLAAFAAYKLMVHSGFMIMERIRAFVPPARLLVLRVFSLGKRSESLFDAITRHWRYLGHVQLITGPDLATTTMDPDEFFDIMRGRLNNHFVDGPESLTNRVNEMDRYPDFDGRYRINEFFCYDNTWQMSLTRLVKESDVVLMDLRGFIPQNAGCTYEVRELVSSVPLNRVVMVIDGTTNHLFLEQMLHQAWAEMRPDSPNKLGSGEIRIVKMDTSECAGFPTVLRLLSAAAEETQVFSASSTAS